MTTTTDGPTETKSTSAAGPVARRRGRPKGSPNKPRPPETTGLRVIPFGEPVPIEHAGYAPEAGELLSVSPKVVLTRKQAFGDPLSELEIDWPPEWRLPQAGEAIHVSKDVAGFVEWVTWNVEKKQVEIRLR